MSYRIGELPAGYDNWKTQTDNDDDDYDIDPQELAAMNADLCED